MFGLINLHNSIFDGLERSAGWLVPTLARVIFAAIFLIYFWNSAGLKFDGSIFSASAGAFGQTLPKAEYLLPALIILGLFTRLAALAMIGFVAVQTFVDVTGHGVALGGFFDNNIGLLDQRTLWVFLLLILVFRGAGPISLDWPLSRAAGTAPRSEP